MTNKDHLLDVLVIGGGYTGLSCGLTLQKQKANFLLLEATARLGGRTFEKETYKHFRLELGGQYIAPIQTRVTKLVEDLHLSAYQAWGKGDHFLLYEEKIGLHQSTPAKCLADLLKDPTIQFGIEKALS